MISLCMIVKNEESFIEKCLQSVAGYVDDIVVADTGSTDRTKEIAQKYNARVFDFEWVNDFSAARNFSASHAKHDWIFVLDADEVVISFDKSQVEDFIEGSSDIGSILRYEQDAGDIIFSERITRLYDRRFFYYTGSIHEQITPVRKGTPYNIIPISVKADHYGYSPQIMEAKSKLERNRSMLEKELIQDPDNPYLLYQMGKAYFAMGERENDAVVYFEKALAQKPGVIYLYVYNLVECYGYALLRCGQYKKSLSILNYAEYFGQNPNFRFLLAHICQNNGKLLEALDYFESCIGQEEDDVTGICSYLAYYNIGVILEIVGMTDNARAYYRQCGDYEPALKRLSELN